MKTATRRLRQWSIDESGTTAIESGPMAAVITVAIVGAVAATGTSLTAIYTFWSGAVVAALYALNRKDANRWPASPQQASRVRIRPFRIQGTPCGVD